MMSTCMPPPCYALTVGDPTGIGPEITAKLLHTLFSPTVNGNPLPYGLNVIGQIEHLQQTATALGLTLPPANHQLTYTPIPLNPVTEAGAIAFTAVETAVALTHAKKTQGIVTGPISKQNLWHAGFTANGHTEILETTAQQLWQDPTLQADMIFLFKQFRLLLLTRHIPLMAVSTALKKPATLAAIQRFIHFLQQVEQRPQPRLAIMGVNPHAGEIGGIEEQDILMPLINTINQQIGANTLSNPQPADALFRGFNPENPPFDGYIATYHDQGLIPMKLVAGLAAVNVTIGLPFIRTSVSHGVATDIVGRNLACPSSLHGALHTLHQLAQASSSL